MLTKARIQHLAQERGVNSAGVHRFLGRVLPECRSQPEARRHYDDDKHLYRWNAATQRACLIGMREHFAASPRSASRTRAAAPRRADATPRRAHVRQGGFAVSFYPEDVIEANAEDNLG